MITRETLKTIFHRHIEAAVSEIVAATDTRMDDLVWSLVQPIAAPAIDKLIDSIVTIPALQAVLSAA